MYVRENVTEKEGSRSLHEAGSKSFIRSKFLEQEKIQSLPYYNEGCLVTDLKGRVRYNRAVGGKH